MDGPSAHDEMARAIRTAIGLLEDEEMALPETRVEAALWTLRQVAAFANGPAVDLDATWNAFSLRPENCHMCDVDGKCALHKEV
jgi:hypothetical protein